MRGISSWGRTHTTSMAMTSCSRFPGGRLPALRLRHHRAKILGSRWGLLRSEPRKPSEVKFTTGSCGYPTSSNPKRWKLSNYLIHSDPNLSCFVTWEAPASDLNLFPGGIEQRVAL